MLFDVVTESRGLAILLWALVGRAASEKRSRTSDRADKDTWDTRQEKKNKSSPVFSPKDETHLPLNEVWRNRFWTPIYPENGVGFRGICDASSENV
jgi:hypothetical protein